MYDRARRFKDIYSATPSRVGPATYFIPDKQSFCQDCNFSDAPFNSSQIRDTSIVNRSLAENPSPNKYKICFRKHRIVGGTSLKNRGPRVKHRSANEKSRGPYPTTEPRRLSGKIHRGVPPRKAATTVSSVPERGTEGYDITSEGPVKIRDPPKDQPVGPTTYYNPEGHHNFTTVTYKGNFWSLRTARRFQTKERTGPGPAPYNVGEKIESPLQQFQDLLQSRNKAEAPLLRSNDLLQRQLCRQNIPGPGYYSPFDPNTKKCECGNGGTFYKACRQPLCQVAEGPGPAAYVDPRSAIKIGTGPSVKDSPFNLDAPSFERPYNMSLPGPTDYSPDVGLWSDVKKRGHSKFAQMNAPFDSSAQRVTAMAKAGSACIPGPDWYFPQFQKKGNQSKSYMFASKSKRGAVIFSQPSPGPAAGYSVTEAFKTVSNSKSHLQSTSAAFWTSAERMKPLSNRCAPDPTTYNLPESLSNTKGCKISDLYKEKKKEITPGPQDYKVHPKYAKSSVFDSYNVVLKPPIRRPPNRLTMNMEKKLRCFYSHVYEHCPRTNEN